MSTIFSEVGLIMQKLAILLFFSVTSVFITSCRGGAADSATVFDANTELAQQVGDSMSSVDESAGGSGNFAMMNEIKSAESSIAFFSPTRSPSKIKLLSESVSTAFAASCFGTGFSTCSSNTVSRNFSNCTLGSATFSGTVAFSYSGTTAATCKLSVATDAVTRNPNFTISTSYGSVTASKTGTAGQTLTYVSGTAASKVLSLTSDGLRRVVTVDGSTKSDITSLTTSAITVTGSDRTTRVMNGGTLRLQNNLTTERCDLVPSAVTWSGTCTCATSGSWAGTCDTKGAFNLAITGCGTANLTVGTETKAVTLTRCSGS